MIGLSVVPGLPKRCSTPWLTSDSIRTCLPRISYSFPAITPSAAQAARGRLTRARPSSRPGRRVGAIVRGRPEELVGPIGPELGHHGVGVDDGVLQPAADLLHLEDVDVLRRVAVVVELDGPAGILGRLARLPQGGEEPVAVLHVTV